ncbi:MAG TPA: hypothetical protein VFW07_26680 [Parafilimonas sp.]|nr:hypothetical protein [Parafilimonas sp.]
MIVELKRVLGYERLAKYDIDIQEVVRFVKNIGTNAELTYPIKMMIISLRLRCKHLQASSQPVTGIYYQKKKFREKIQETQNTNQRSIRKNVHPQINNHLMIKYTICIENPGNHKCHNIQVVVNYGRKPRGFEQQPNK